MKLATHTDIARVIGNGYSEFVFDSWLEIGAYVFNDAVDRPFGLVGTAYDESTDTTYIASTAVNPELIFNHEMLKYILKINRTKNISVITDMPEYQEKVRLALAPHGFAFRIDNDIMYSFRKATIQKVKEM